MKDSTKEYLMAGAGFTWAFAKTLVAKTINPGANSYSCGTQTGRSIQQHWDKAGALREEEKAAAKIPIDGAFLLPYASFKDSAGKDINGGLWRLRMVDGLRLLLYKQEPQEVRHWFKWEDIKEYYLE